jgi:hypothetical protein
MLDYLLIILAKKKLFGKLKTAEYFISRQIGQIVCPLLGSLRPSSGDHKSFRLIHSRSDPAILRQQGDYESGDSARREENSPILMRRTFEMQRAEHQYIREGRRRYPCLASHLS